jgi:hypothetical protein
MKHEKFSFDIFAVYEFRKMGFEDSWRLFDGLSGWDVVDWDDVEEEVKIEQKLDVSSQKIRQILYQIEGRFSWKSHRCISVLLSQFLSFFILF